MVDITLNVQNPNSWHGTMNALRNDDFFDKSPFYTDKNGDEHLGNLFVKGGRGDVDGNPYEYVLDPGDPEANPPVPPTLHAGLHWNMRVSLECFEAFLPRLNPQNKLPGGAEMLWATGLPFDENDPSPTYPNGEWGNPQKPQRVWL